MFYFTDKYLIVQSYDKLLKVSEEEIVFIIFKKTVLVSGTNLTLPFFEKDEFKIKGLINKIEVYEN